ncbi:MAG: hypothetical protein OCU22_10045 [Canidatus Methanoxibalbensis ujae]|nr:hypothetical protein [Candidatus Methanoxibalbensis ujae]
MKMISKKSKWFVILGMIVVSVTAAVFAGAYIIQSPAHIGNNSNITHDGNRNQSISYATYTTANFTMDYPADWTVIPMASKIVFVSKTGYEGGYITLNIQLLSSVESGGIYNSVEDVVADLVQRFPGDVKNVSNVSINYEREEMLGGTKGIEISISYTAHNISYTQTQIIAQKGKYFYVLTYHAPTAYYGEYEEAYEYAKKHWTWKFS